MFRVFATHGALLWGERNKCEARSLVYHVLKVYLANLGMYAKNAAPTLGETETT